MFTYFFDISTAVSLACNIICHVADRKFTIEEIYCIRVIRETRLVMVPGRETIDLLIIIPKKRFQVEIRLSAMPILKPFL
jgi:hypothetical protein